MTRFARPCRDQLRQVEGNASTPRCTACVAQRRMRDISEPPVKVDAIRGRIVDLAVERFTERVVIFEDEGGDLFHHQVDDALAIRTLEHVPLRPVFAWVETMRQHGWSATFRRKRSLPGVGDLSVRSAVGARTPDPEPVHGDARASGVNEHPSWRIVRLRSGSHQSERTGPSRSCGTAEKVLSPLRQRDQARLASEKSCVGRAAEEDIIGDRIYRENK